MEIQIRDFSTSNVQNLAKHVEESEYTESLYCALNSCVVVEDASFQRCVGWSVSPCSVGAVPSIFQVMYSQ